MKRRLSPYTINKTLTRLSQIMEDAERYGLIRSNPVRHARRLKAARPDVGYLEPFQIEPLLEEIPARYRVLFELLIRAGLRIGEALALRWRDVNLHGSVLHLRRTVWRGEVSRLTKSGERDALVRMTPQLARILATWQLAEHDSGRGAGDDLVFPSKRGTPLRGDNLRKRALRPAVRRANEKLAAARLPTISERLTLHDLRRSCCSLLFASGASVPEAMERMRHRDESTTLRIYAKVLRSRDSEVDAALDALISGHKLATNSDPNEEQESAEAPNSAL